MLYPLSYERSSVLLYPYEVNHRVYPRSETPCSHESVHQASRTRRARLRASQLQVPNDEVHVAL